MVITIDGPAASGKSTAARLLAQRLGVAYLDPGAMYRAVTLAGRERGIDLSEAAALTCVAREARIDLEPRGEGIRVLLDGCDVTEAIRENRVSRQAYHAAGNPEVRQCLVEAQRAIGSRWGDLVTEGRDQGTVVFPEADLKVYLDASEEVRARRRRDELAARGQEVPLSQIRREMARRDRSDRARRVGPLKVADEGVVVDTSEMSIGAMGDRLEALARSRLGRR